MIIHRSDLDEKMADMSECVSSIYNIDATEEEKQIIYEYEKNNPIILKIRFIPHLKLKLPTFDIERALSEVNDYYQTDDFSQLEITGIPPEEGGSYFKYEGEHPTWGGRALVNYTPSSVGTWGKDDRLLAIKHYPHLQERAAKLTTRRPLLQDMNFYKTELWDKLPYITNYITENICEDFSYMRRTFLFRLKSGGCLTFHNHRREPWETHEAPHDEGIIHIPLVTHPSALMYQQIGDSDWIDAQHYDTGETWLFNSYMNHAVDNRKSPINRLHLTITVDFADRKFRELIERSINE